jgi:hypothetical protein
MQLTISVSFALSILSASPDNRQMNTCLGKYENHFDEPRGNKGAKYLFFSFSRSLKTREKYISFAQFVYFLRELNFIIQKLKDKHTFLKKYTN